MIKKVIAQMESEERRGSRVLGRSENGLPTSPPFQSVFIGYRKLSDLVRKTNSFEIEPEGGATRIPSSRRPDHLRRREPLENLRAE